MKLSPMTRMWLDLLDRIFGIVVAVFVVVCAVNYFHKGDPAAGFAALCFAILTLNKSDEKS